MKKILVSAIIMLCQISAFFVVRWSSEITEAVSRLYSNGLTKYTNTTTFRANNTIRRDEAAKFFSVFAKNVLERPNIATSSSCRNFKDLSATNTMRIYVLDACSRGYVLGSNWRFTPTSSLTNAQAIAIVIRMIMGKQDESGTHRANQYYARAEELWLTDGLNIINKWTPITRGTLGILLYRVGNLPDLDTYIQQNNIDIVSSDKPDLVLYKVGLNPNVTAPKVGDDAMTVDFTVKNIWAPIHLSSGVKMIFSCWSSVKKELTNGYIGPNQTFSIAGVTSDPTVYLFPEAKNYTFNCSINISSSTVYESNENNNNKSFSLDLGATSYPDIRIDTISINSGRAAPIVWDDLIYFDVKVNNVWAGNFVLTGNKNMALICKFTDRSTNTDIVSYTNIFAWSIKRISAHQTMSFQATSLWTNTISTKEWMNAIRCELKWWQENTGWGTVIFEDLYGDSNLQNNTYETQFNIL